MEGIALPPMTGRVLAARQSQNRHFKDLVATVPPHRWTCRARLRSLPTRTSMNAAELAGVADKTRARNRGLVSLELFVTQILGPLPGAEGAPTTWRARLHLRGGPSVVDDLTFIARNHIQVIA